MEDGCTGSSSSAQNSTATPLGKVGFDQTGCKSGLPSTAAPSGGRLSDNAAPTSADSSLPDVFDSDSNLVAIEKQTMEDSAAMGKSGAITVPVVNMAGRTLTSVSLTPYDKAASLRMAAAKALGGRACRIVLSEGGLVEDSLPVSAAGLRDGTPVTAISQQGVEAIFSTKKAFLALKSDGSVVIWGDAGYGGDLGDRATLLHENVQLVRANHHAFAVLLKDGAVIAWGNYSKGGQLGTAVGKLGGGVANIFATDSAFAALKEDGSVVAWGDWGGDLPSWLDVRLRANAEDPVTEIFSTKGAFAALKSSGSVWAWGRIDFGGDPREVQSQLSGGVLTVSATRDAFAALKKDGSVVAWGAVPSGELGAASDHLREGVACIKANDYAFAAIKMDGSVVTWGNRDWGGNCSGVARQLNGEMPVCDIFSTDSAFAALRMDGSVVAWGEDAASNTSGVQSALSSDIETIASTQSAFCAKRVYGGLVAWGDRQCGGCMPQELQMTSGVRQISSSRYAFAVVKSDGSVVTWGHPEWGGHIPTEKKRRLLCVEEIIAADRAFAARQVDGSIVTWGDLGQWDESTLAEQLSGAL